MKKFLLFLLLLPVFCFAQSPVTPAFKRKIPIDSLLLYSFPGVTGTFALPDTAWIRKHISSNGLDTNAVKLLINKHDTLTTARFIEGVSAANNYNISGDNGSVYNQTDDAITLHGTSGSGSFPTQSFVVSGLAEAYMQVEDSFAQVSSVAVTNDRVRLVAGFTTSGPYVGLDVIYNRGVKIIDSVNNKGAYYDGDYSTNQRLNRFAIPSVKTVIVLADSIKGTISGRGVSSFNTRTGVVVPVAGDYASLTETLTNKSGNISQWTNDSGYLLSSTAASTYQTLANLETTVTNSAMLYPSGSAVETYVSGQISGITGFVPTARTITINGNSQDLSANRTYTITTANTDTASTGFATQNSLIPYQTKAQNIASYVPLSRTVAGLPLSSNVTFAALTNGFGVNTFNYTAASAASIVIDTAVAVKGKTGYLTDYNNLKTSIALKANSASPSFSGTITAASLTGYIKGSTGVLSAVSTIPYSDITGGPASLTAGRGILIPSTAVILDTTQNYNWLKVQTVTLNNLGTTSVAGLLLQNTTAAALNAQQISPSDEYDTFGWKTSGTPGSESVKSRTNLLAVQGSTDPSALYQVQFNVNNAGWNTRFTIKADGSLSVNGGQMTVDGGSGNTTVGALASNGYVIASSYLQLNQSKTTVSGSTSGSAQFNEPFNGSGYKKVMIYCNALLGTAVYNFPIAFISTPVVVTTNGPAASVVTSLSTTSVTITGATTTGFIILEGY